MKIKKALCLTMATLLSATGFAACGGGQAGVVDNEKTLNIKVFGLRRYVCSCLD